MAPEVTFELEGWELFWAELRLTTDDCDVSGVLAGEMERARGEHRIETLAEEPVVAGMRRLFRAAGCDPTRYRPASEALLRRVLKGGDLPAIHPFVDVNNCLSLRLAVPCCVMAEGSFEPPFVVRAGMEGEEYESLRGALSLAKRPILVDVIGPCDTPISGSRRVMIQPDTRQVSLVAYLPAGEVSVAQASQALDDILSTTLGIVRVTRD